MLDLIQTDKMSDTELVALSLENQANFVFLIKRYKSPLFNYIRRLSNLSPEDAEDLLQEIFLKVYLNLNDFNSDLKFSSWIYRIAHNQVISSYRKFKARPEGYAVNVDDLSALNLVADIDIVAGTDLNIMKKKINQVLNNLSQKHRDILILKFLEEKNYQEISDIIQRPLGTVGSLLNQAKKEFKLELKKNNIKI